MCRVLEVVIALVIAGTPGVMAQVFDEISGTVGTSMTHEIAPICNPAISTGSAWADFDNDGDVDLFITNHGGADRLYRNEGDVGPVDGLPDFVDVAASLGLADAGVGLGVVFIDYDNDGDQDLQVLRWKGNAFYQNQLVETGSATFVDVSDETGLVDDGRPITAAWGDFDEDGDLDVYLGKHGECNSDFTANNDDRLFQNDGDGTFTDVTDWLCVGCDAIAMGLAFAPSWVDYDLDGDLDLYVVNDDIGGIHSPNVMWNNGGSNGTGGWIFTDVSDVSGTGISLNGMGLGIGDYNNDGLLDFAFSNFGPNILLENNGDGTFTNVSGEAGITRETTPLGDPSITWGTVFLDFDNDMNVDLFQVAGYIAVEPFEQPSALHRNKGDRTFEDISAFSGLDDDGRGRSASIGDFDRDGSVDLLVGNYGGDLLMYRNNAAAHQAQLGAVNHWLAITAEGSVSDLDAIGTRFWLETPDGTRQTRHITSGSTHGGGDEKAAYYGLASHTEGRLSISWPDGQAEIVDPVAADQRLHVVQPEFLLGGPVPGIGGQVNTIALTGAAPNTPLRLYVSKEGGTTGVTGCSLLPLELERPMPLGVAISDSSGSATFTFDIPGGASGRTLQLQVADVTNCATSSRVAFMFE